LRDFDPAFATHSVIPTTSSPLLLPYQTAGAEALVNNRRENVLHTDPMDVLYQKCPIWFSRDGHVTTSPSFPQTPPVRTMSIHGTLLTEAIGTGKTRTAVEILRRILLAAEPITPVPPPRGRTAVNAMTIVVPSYIFLSWKTEIQTILGKTCRVHYVQQPKGLVGLANKIQTVDIVLFSENVFRKTFDPFSKEHQTLWTTWWRLLIVDEVHTYVDGTKAKAGGCWLTRKAVTIKSLLAPQYTLLITATPNLKNIAFLNVFAYLLGVTGYPLPQTLHDLARTVGPIKTLENYTTVPEESMIKARNLLLQHHIVTTGTTLSIVDTRETRYTINNSCLNRYFHWYAMSKIEEGESTDSFVDQCRAVITTNPSPDEILQTWVLEHLDRDEANQDRLGKIVPLPDNNHADQMNAYQVPARLTPAHAGLVRLITWLIDEQDANILIYDGLSTAVQNRFWKHPKTVLKQNHNIDRSTSTIPTAKGHGQLFLFP
jgi:hypothetical protein